MKPAIDGAYTQYYGKRDSDVHIYPVEFVVRTFLGTYPRLKLDRSKYVGASVLDLGFGDGRNFPLLHNLGMRVSGVEIDERIVQSIQEKFERLGLPTELKVGRNSSIPFDAGAFDYLVGCHAIYYVDAGETFDDNLREMARVLRPGGTLIASLVAPSSYIVKNAKPLPGGHAQITSDPLGLRNGSVFRVFGSENEIRESFGKYFEDFSLGKCLDDFFGVQQDVWILKCVRNSRAV